MEYTDAVSYTHLDVYKRQYIDNIFSTYCNELYSIVDTYDNLPDKLKEKHIRCV